METRNIVKVIRVSWYQWVIKIHILLLFCGDKTMPELEANHAMQEHKLEGKTVREATWIPLSALLSQALVAFTIEFDNEFEHQMPHRTTNHGSTSDLRYAPWCASMVMWFNCMQFLPEEGLSIGELQHLARVGTNLNGLRRWGYISIEPTPTDGKPDRPRSGAIVRPTRAGRKAQEIWRPLPRLIEERWRERFSIEKLDQLRESLWTIVQQLHPELPDCLPILGYGLSSREHVPGNDRFLIRQSNNEQLTSHEREDDSASSLPFPTLLARVLLMLALEFEYESDVSLAISANVLRVLDEQGVRVKDLPVLSGVSKEALSMTVGYLEKRHLAVVEPDPTGSRFNVVRLTTRGREIKETSDQLLGIIEKRWQSRFGKDTVLRLRKSLEYLISSSLLVGLEPYPDGWRASVRKPDTLPYFPMILHRGGFPDGS